MLLTSHVRGIAQQSRASGTEAEARLVAALAGVLREHGDDYPATLAAMTAPTEERDQALTFGVERILDGLEALIARRAGS